MNRKILCLDPAGNYFGVVVLQLDNGIVHIPMHFLLTAPSMWDYSRKNNYMAHAVASLVLLEKPDVVVSEKPWGAGFSKQTIQELLGAIKAEVWQTIVWQGVSEARRGIIGDGYGASDKQESAEWLLNYPFSVSAKRFIKNEILNANIQTKEGYDILDAIMHGVYYLVDNGLISAITKEPKKIKKKKNILKE